MKNIMQPARNPIAPIKFHTKSTLYGVFVERYQAIPILIQSMAIAEIKRGKVVVYTLDTISPIKAGSYAFN